jgi:hypothetical protein
VTPARFFDDVSTWRHGPLDEAEALALARANELAEIANSFAMSGPVDWQGTAANGARLALGESLARLWSLVRGLEQIRTALIHASDDVWDLERLVGEAQTVASANDFVINPDGSVTDRGTRPPVPGGDAEDVNRDLARKRAELTEQVRLLLARATEIDVTLAEELRAATIVHQYQVEDDPQGMAKYFGEKVTATESTMLGKLSILSKLDFKSIQDQAFFVAPRHFREEGDDGEDGSQSYTNPHQDDREDAFRHAYWNALMTRRFGAEWTEKYATVHEQVPGNPPEREAMDLYNNQVGREIAQRFPDVSDKELQQLIHDAVDRGEMVIIGKEGGLNPSNSPYVPPGPPGYEDQAPSTTSE